MNEQPINTILRNLGAVLCGLCVDKSSDLLCIAKGKTNFRQVKATWKDLGSDVTKNFLIIRYVQR